mgnify:CR=1 FL=1
MDAESVWGTSRYSFWKHRRQTCVFFGCYSLRDVMAIAAHRGKKYILWAGSDIRSWKDGLAFSDGKMKWLSKLTRGKFDGIVMKVLASADSFVENETEAAVLREMGVKVTGVCPSFMGRISDYLVTFKPKKRAQIYVSAGQGRGKEYGFETVCRIAARLPWYEFHLFGDDWNSDLRNVYCHGRVPAKVFADETSKMQIALSLNDFCGFSEVVARAILRGQYAISKVPHPQVPSFQDEIELVMTLNRLGKMTSVNYPARNYYLQALYKFPWYAKG